MLLPKPLDIKARILVAVTFGSCLAVPACTVSVKGHDGDGENKVDISTPLGGIHVNEQVDVRDTGLAVYPGARQKTKDSNDSKSANVNISSGLFGVKVVAVEFESDDTPDKVIAFYQDQLKKYGGVIECHTDKRGGDMTIKAGDSNSHNPVSCKSGESGKVVELKAGTEDNQHLVSVEPNGKGTDFALVYVLTRGKESTI
ncbi:MAG TPA: hypothetical protein VF753_10035 [Terriglobales bacterium]